MENVFEITVGYGHQLQPFEVKDSSNLKGVRSKFDVFRKGLLVLTVEPDGDYLRTCKNPGGLDKETINQVIDKIEAHYL
ncbi:MAG TPA: hypothetical protein DCO83_14005 [Mucilaginibacter sp.]|jgi:hypothetical protein|nr:hypothetical protein [Mucilaginibacter sp.]